jgi:large subunit ribosomal protein L4
MESQAHQGVIASAPEFPGAVEFDASAPMMQPVWEYQTAPTSSSWTWLLAAGSMALLPLVYLYKKLAAQEDSVFDEVLEAEAWAMASTVGAVDAPASAQVRVVDLSGASCGTEELSLKTAGVNSRHVVHKKLVAELANRRQSNAHTKTRAEVSGGGKKPYAQKGTGNARRGSTRSPLIVGGGVTFGPRNNKNYKQSINKKEGRLAISSLIQNRASLISVVKDLESAMPEISTKKAKELIVSLTGEAEEFQKGGKVLVVVEDTEAWDPKNTLYLSMRNIPNVRYMQQKQLAVADLLWPKRILMSEKAMASIKERFNA